MKLKKQHLIVLAAVLILAISVASIALMFSTENGQTPNGNGNSPNGTENPPNVNGEVPETGDWIDLSNNINAVATRISTIV